MHKITAADVQARFRRYIQCRSNHVDLQVSLHLIDADSIIITRNSDDNIIRVLRITPRESIESSSIVEYKTQTSTRVLDLELEKKSTNIDIDTLLKIVYDDLLFDNARIK